MSTIIRTNPDAIKKKPALYRAFRDYGWCYLFIAVPVLMFLVFTLYPVGSALLMSFQKYDVMNSQWIGFQNYTTMFTDATFWKSMKNTVLFTIGTVPVNIALTFTLAFFIDQFKKRTQTFFKAAMYLPTVASGVTLSLVWLWMFDPTSSGLFNSLLELLGLNSVIWLGKSSTALFSLMLMTYLTSHGGGIILYLAAMGGIPKSLYEAADIDHATSWSKFRHITWPLVKPTTLYLLVTGVITSFQVFISVYLMTQGGPDFSTTTIAYLIYQNAFEFYNFGLAAAESFVLAFVIILVSFLQFKYFSSDIEY